MTSRDTDPPGRRERVDGLMREIRRHRRLYYNATPEISDAEFDALEDELRGLDPENPVLAEVGASPADASAGLADAPVVGLPTKRHRIPMGSLEKIPEDRMEAWAEKSGPLFLVQEKLDGISLEIEYEKGQMGDAITRGDGFVGEVVTHNAVHFRNVRRKLSLPFSGSVRGEVILRKSEFERHFAGADFANPRNTVSGTVRRKRGDLSVSRHLEVHFYDLVTDDRQFSTEREKMEFLRDELGLHLARSFFDQELGGVRRIYREYLGEDDEGGRRLELDYDIDGLVVRADSLERQAQLGVLRNRPRYAMAYKFPSVGQATVLRAVEWSLGVGARVTPVARLEPVQVGGVMVSNATLHNHDYIKALGVRAGDLVLVERKGDVIPQVVRVLESRGGKPPAPPRSCPSCQEPLDVAGKHLRCPNRRCPGKAFGDLMRWVAELEIDALGEKWVEILIEKGIVSDPADLYSLTAEELTPLERMGETLASKIIRNIQESRRPSLDRFVAALNIPEFSRQRAQLLIDAGYGSLEALLAAPPEDLCSVKGFGEILAEKAVKGLAARRGRIDRLLDAGVEVAPARRPRGGGGPLAGKTFCFTGTLKTLDPETEKPYTRKRIEERVAAMGGQSLSDVSSRLDYLVLANPASRSSKAEKARRMGKTLLSEEEFFQMIASGSREAPTDS